MSTQKVFIQLMYRFAETARGKLQIMDVVVKWEVKQLNLDIIYVRVNLYFSKFEKKIAAVLAQEHSISSKIKRKQDTVQKATEEQKIEI